MQEYSKDYNGMNDWKVLFHKDRLQAIVDGKPMAPVSVDTDPSNVCTQKCNYCNAYMYRKKTGFQQMPEGHLIKLADMYKDWGVLSTCFHPETLIVTKNNVKRIIDINMDDECMTLCGEYKKVTNLMLFECNDNLIEITIQGTKTLVTKDHKIDVIEPKYCTQKINKNLICREPCYSYCTKKYYKDYYIITKRADEIKKDDIVLLPYIENYKKENFIIKFDDYKENDHYHKKLKTNIEMNNDIAYLLGWYVAEGCSYNGRIILTLNINEIEYAEQLKQIIKKEFGIDKANIKTEEDKNIVRIIFCSVLIGRFLNEKCGHGALNKKIPDIFTKEQMMYFLKGLFLGDGCFLNNKVDKRGYISNRFIFVTISPTLAYQVKEKLVNFNIFPRTRIKEENGIHKQSYIIQVNGDVSLHLENTMMNNENIFYSDNRRKGCELVNINRIKYIGHRIKDIKETPYKGNVYNITVEDEHNYNTFMFNAHNCIAGGGEPLVNPEVKEMIPRLYKNNVEVGMITNGVGLDENYTDILTDKARFCGISFDGDNPKTYELMRGRNHFDIVVKNIKKLNEYRIKKNSILDTNLKFLIHPYNYKEIYGVAKLAKEIGCCGVHIRPAGIDNVPGVINPMEKWSKEELDDYGNKVTEEISKTWELVDKNFNVYAVRHKFSPTLQRVIKFDKCRCTPLAGVFGSDGWFHLCFSMRGRKGFRLARHIPDPYEVMKIWGSKEHLELMKNIDPKECMRCAFTRYNEVIEECMIKDGMFKNFL